MNIKELLETLGKDRWDDINSSLTSYRSYRGLEYSLHLNEFDEWEANYNTEDYSLRTSNVNINECILEIEKNIDILIDEGI